MTLAIINRHEENALEVRVDFDHFFVLSEEQVGKVFTVDYLILLVQDIVKARVDLVEILEDQSVAVLDEEWQSCGDLEVVVFGLTISNVDNLACVLLSVVT